MITVKAKGGSSNLLLTLPAQRMLSSCLMHFPDLTRGPGLSLCQSPLQGRGPSVFKAVLKPTQHHDLTSPILGLQARPRRWPGGPRYQGPVMRETSWLDMGPYFIPCVRAWNKSTQHCCRHNIVGWRDKRRHFGR